MASLNKYDLPCAYKLSHIKFDLNKLRQALSPFQFTDIYEANKGLCENHHQLASSVKEHFFQVSLTKCSTPAKDFSLENCKNKAEGSRSQKYRLATSRRNDFPWLDEHNWNIPTKLFQESYFYECTKLFKSPIIRARLTTLNPGKTITPHIDYNVDYAVRIIIPIYTNKQCWNYFWRQGRKIKLHISADGHPWFLNVALKHSVENLGDSNRTVFMFSLAGTSDIQHLQNKKEPETVKPCAGIKLHEQVRKNKAVH